MGEFGTSTLLTALVLGGLTFLAGWRWSFQMLAALIILVPFRDLTIRWMNAYTSLSPDWVNALSRWWFIMILGLLAVVVLQWIRSWIRARKPVRLGLIEITFGLMIIVSVIHTLISRNFSVAFTSLRGYLQPMAVFVIAAALRPTRRQLQILLVLLLFVGIIIAALEFWQVAGWSADDYRARGYLRQNGELVTPTIEVRGQDYIRPTSTVSGPNELGVDMMLLMLITVFGSFYFKGSMRTLSLLLLPFFALGVVLTFSRSAILGTALSLLVFGILLLLSARPTREKYSKKLPRGLIIGGIGVVVLVLMMLIFTGALEFMVDTIASLSSQYHFLDSFEAFQFLLKNPAGVGMGMVEPKGAMILIESEPLFHVEGSLFQIAMEMGVWGFGLWAFFWGASLVRLWRRWPDLIDPLEKVWTGTAIAGWIGALVAFLFLPLMQSISLMVWLWFLLALPLGFSPKIGHPEQSV